MSNNGDKHYIRNFFHHFKAIYMLFMLFISLTFASITTPLIHADTLNTFSGVLLDDKSNPIGGFNVRLIDNFSGMQYFSTTDGNGQFNISAPPSTYALSIYTQNSYAGFGGGVGVFNYNPYENDISLINGSITQDFTLAINNITVAVKDSSGNPLSGIQVLAQPMQGASQVAPGISLEPDSWFFAITDNDGNAVVKVIKGSRFGQQYGPNDLSNYYMDNLCASINNKYVCIPAPLTVNSDVSVTIQDRPTPPSNLIANTPTVYPSLTWDTVQNATSYNIYRNDTLIGSTATNTYLDNSAPEGSNSYYVTAVENIAESNPSNIVNLTVDRTAPLINYSLSPTPNLGWNKSIVTVSFACSDNLSGISTCSNPTTLTNEGGGQVVYGAAVDNAGNIATISIPVNIDLTAPTVGTPTITPSPIKQSVGGTVSVSASDLLSGVTGGEYFFDTDPGIGNGIPMTLSGSILVGTIAPNSINSGQHRIYVRSKDKAGNWSVVSVGVRINVNNS